MENKIKGRAQRLDGRIEAARQSEDGERLFEVLFYAGAPVPYYPYRSLTLSLEEGAVDLTRISHGRAPFLLDHASYSVGAVIGVIRDVKISPDGARATILMSRRSELDGLWQDIQSGILSNVSVGAIPNKIKETTPEGASIRTGVCTSWTPYEVSLVAIGQDPKAQILLSGSQEFDIEIELGAHAPPIEEVPQVDPTNAPGVPPPASPPNLTEIQATAVSRERERIQQIRARATRARMDEPFIQTHIDQGSTVEAVNAAIVDALAARSETSPTRPHHVEAGRDEVETFRAGLEQALEHRFTPGIELTAGREYAYMSVVEMAKQCAKRAGWKEVRMSSAEFVERVMLNQHMTGDFPNILANVANKRLQAGYNVAPTTYAQWAGSGTVRDFKQVTQVRMGEASPLLEIPEGTEIKYGTFGEQKEVWQIASYGRGFRITRQALINDDLSAFQRILPAMGQAAARLRNKLVYAKLTSNPTMGDGTALFHANHGNLAGAGTAIAIASLSVMRTAFRLQKGVDAATVLNVQPRYILIPAEQETLAQQFLVLTGVIPTAQTGQNPFVGTLTPIADAELSANSTLSWYGVADSGQIPTIQYVTLEGFSSPRLLQQQGWMVEGIDYQVRDDFGVAAADWRGLYKNPGA